MIALAKVYYSSDNRSLCIYWVDPQYTRTRFLDDTGADNRCDYAEGKCFEEQPDLYGVSDSHGSACFRYEMFLKNGSEF